MFVRIEVELGTLQEWLEAVESAPEEGRVDTVESWCFRAVLFLLVNAVNGGAVRTTKWRWECCLPVG